MMDEVTDDSGGICNFSVFEWDIKVGPHKDLWGGVEELSEVFKSGFSKHIDKWCNKKGYKCMERFIEQGTIKNK